MKQMINKTHSEGLLHSHKLERKVTGPDSKNPGTDYIAGRVSIATDDEGINVNTIEYSYVTPLTSKGKENATYTALAAIIDGKTKSIAEHGKDAASIVRADSAIGLKEFYKDNDPNQFISSKINDAGFIHEDTKLAEESARSTFEADIIINSFIVKEEEETEDGNIIPKKGIIKGAIFNFRKELLPVDFIIYNEKGIALFEDMDISNGNLVFTKVWGKQVSTSTTSVKIEENAFGDDKVTEIVRSKKEFVVTGTSVAPYDFDAEETITAKEFEEAVANREITKASILTRGLEYAAKKGTTTPTAQTAGTATQAKKYDF